MLYRVCAVNIEQVMGRNKKYGNRPPRHGVTGTYGRSSDRHTTCSRPNDMIIINGKCHPDSR